MLMLGFGLGALWAILRWLAAFRRKENGRWYDVGLALVVIVLSVTALALENGNTAQFDRSELLAAALGLALFAPGVWIVLTAEKPFSSGGILSAATGLLLVAAAFLIPVYAQNTAPEQTIALPGAASNLSNLSNLPLQALAGAGTAGRSQVAQPLSVPDPVDDVPQAIPTLPLPEVIFTTPTPNPLLAETCAATVTTRLNLRDLPSTGAGSVISVIPENTEVTLVAQDNTNEWWYLLDEEAEVEGWLFGEFLERDTLCNQLPIANWLD